MLTQAEGKGQENEGMRNTAERQQTGEFACETQTKRIAREDEI
jgi:hypothetical protein